MTLRGEQTAAVASVVIPVILVILLLNLIFDVVKVSYEGLPVFLPLFLCPVGVLFALYSYIKDHNRLSKIGFVLNGVLFFLPFVWMIGGTAIFGV